MHFINADRLNIRIDLVALRQIIGVSPSEMVNVEYFGCVGWTQFCGEAIRVGFERQHVTVCVAHGEFVHDPFAYAFNE